MNKTAEISPLAYHEAAHAAIAILMGKIRVLEVVCDGAEGYVKTEYAEAGINFEKLCFFLAGEIGEFHFAPEEYGEHRSRDDRMNTTNVLFLMSDKESVRYKLWLQAIWRVRALIETKENEEKIERIAAALQKKGKLSESDVLALAAY